MEAESDALTEVIRETQWLRNVTGLGPDYIPGY